MLSNISPTTKNQLLALAKKYETHEFVKSDPSFGLYEFSNVRDTEVFAFIVAMLSFGKREQFIKKAKFIQSLCNQSPYEWILSKSYNSTFINTEIDLNSSFYRFYSYSDMLTFFDELNSILSSKSDETFGNFMQKEFLKNPTKHLSDLIAENFPKSKIVPKGKNSPKKRIQMFLRWMVRTNSSVDLGLWNWYEPKNLIIPLDTHVLQQSMNLGLIDKTEKPTLKTAIKITEKLKQIWQLDPVKGDFALFGLGVDT